MEVAKRILFGCCVVIAASVFSAKPLLGQRAWHQGDMWLKWSHEAREQITGRVASKAPTHRFWESIHLKW